VSAAGRSDERSRFVASVGAGAYDPQSGTGAGCRESDAVYVDAVVFVPVTTEIAPCAAELPFLHGGVRPAR
jgi:hypothetical protein